MLEKFLLALCVVTGWAFAAMLYPANGMLIAFAPFCLSMLFSMVAFGALTIVIAIERSRDRAAEESQKLLQAIEGLAARPLGQTVALVEPPAVDPAHPKSWGAISGRGRQEPTL